MRAMRIRTALIAVILLAPLLFTGCEKERVWVPVPTPTPTTTPIPAVQPIPWDFPLWSEVLGDIEECIPGEEITIREIKQSGSGVEVEFDSSERERYVRHLYDYVSCLETRGNYSVNVPAQRMIVNGGPLSIHVEVNKDYTLYVDGANVWYYPVYHPASSYIFNPGSIAWVVAHDAGIEIIKTVQNTSTMTVDGFLYSVDSYEFTALADEGLVQVIEFLGLLEERGQLEYPIISLNLSGNQSVEEMTINQSETSSLWKIDDLNLKQNLSQLEFKLLFLFK
jgi:hypothetical protein